MFSHTFLMLCPTLSFFAAAIQNAGSKKTCLVLKAVSLTAPAASLRFAVVLPNADGVVLTPPKGAILGWDLLIEQLTMLRVWQALGHLLPNFHCFHDGECAIWNARARACDSNSRHNVGAQWKQ